MHSIRALGLSTPGIRSPGLGSSGRSERWLQRFIIPYRSLIGVRF